MRVVHVISLLEPRSGGPSFALLGLVRAQRAAGIDASIIATHAQELPPWPQFSSLVNEGCPIDLFRLSAGKFGGLDAFKERLNEVVQENDIVHIHGVWHSEQRLAAVLAKRFNKPYLIRPCGMLAPWSMSQKRLKKLIYLVFMLNHHLRDAAGIHFTTQRESKSCVQAATIPKPIVEPNGIDREEFGALPEPGSFRKQNTLAPHAPIVLFLGRIHHKKGLRLLLPAFKEVKNAILVIAGPDNDEETPKLLAQIDQLGLAQRVHFLGPLYGAARLAAFQDATVFVLPSYHENFGNTVIESLACGTPIIISDQVDLCEDLNQYDVCTIVPLDVQKIAGALQSQLSLPSSAERSDQCKAIAFSRFDWNEIGRRWVGHYESLLAK